MDAITTTRAARPRAPHPLRNSHDDKQPSVSAPDGRLLAAKSERVRLPNTSPNSSNLTE